MKKIVSSLLIIAGLFVLLGIAGAVSASTTPKLYLDGKQLATDVDPVIRSGTTLVPLSVVSTGLGYEVKWNQQAQQVTVLDKDVTIKLTIGEKLAYVNEASYELTQAPSLEKSRTMVPVRFVSQVLGLSVEWKQQTSEVLLTSPVKEPEPTPTPTPSAVQDATITNVVLQENGNLYIAYTGTLADPKVMLLPKDNNNSADRLVVDLTNTGYTYELAKGFSGGQTNVTANGYLTMSGYRYGQNSMTPLIARIVVLLNDDVTYHVTKTSGEVVISFNGEPVEVPSETPIPTTPAEGNTDIDPDTGGPIVTPTPAPTEGEKVYHIVIDPGHGGKDPGTVNKSLGLYEKTFNLSVSLKLKAELEKNKHIKVHLTRSGDTYPELSERVAFAENIPGVGKKADLFISIHANSFTKDTVRGTETYYYREDSKELAHSLHPYIVKAVGLPDRNVRTASYKVIRETTMPAVLLEVGYLSNSTDAKALFNDSVQAKFAKETAAGIFQYLKLK